MNLYPFLIDFYNRFLAIFPPQLQWIVTLIVLVVLVVGFIRLIKANPLFAIILILVLPLIAPVVQRFLLDLYNFFLYLVHLLGATAPKS